MKRVLIITYYWPPSGGPGVQRWLKFVKYLREFGWEPIIFTPDNPEVPALDPALEKDVPESLKIIKIPAVEPYHWYRKLTGRKDAASIGFTSTQRSGTPSRMDKTIRWIRGNFFIPDARKAFVKPAVSTLAQVLSEQSVDVVVTTGPPHSMHLIGLELKKRFNLPWLADFRDPWTGIDFYDDLMLTKWADKKHRKMEHAVLSNADVVITVSNPIQHELSQKGGKRVEVITNGFDPDDFNMPHPYIKDKFTLLHAGSLIPSRNPHALWEALSRCCDQHPTFLENLSIKLIGKTDSAVMESIKKYSFVESVHFLDYVPHDEIIQEMYASDILLLLINRTRNAEGFLTGKLFEYLAVQKPVFCVGPENGEAAALIHETDSGFSFNFDDIDSMQKQLMKWYMEWLENERIPFNPQKTNIYSRKMLTKKLSFILEDISR